MFGLNKPPIPKRVMIFSPGRKNLGQAAAGQVGLSILTPIAGSTVTPIGADWLSWLTGSQAIPLTIAVSNASGGMALDFALQFVWKETPSPEQNPAQVSQDMGSNTPLVHLEPNQSSTLIYNLPLQTSGWQSMTMEIQVLSKLSDQDNWVANGSTSFTVVPSSD